MSFSLSQLRHLLIQKKIQVVLTSMDDNTLVKNFTGSSKIFKDLLEDLGEDLRKDPQQRSLKILKDPNFSCQDPQKSLQRSSRIFEDLCKIFKDL